MIIIKWRGDRQSNNVEDRTGNNSDGSGGFPTGNLVKGGGVGTIIIVALLFFLDGSDLSSVLNTLDVSQPQQQAPMTQTQSKADTDRKEFVSVVFAHLEVYWVEAFAVEGRHYAQPNMVLFSGNVQTACGPATSAVGPFYCPGDKKVYLDLAFMDELATEFGATGDFAMAYVVAHEVGHHIQQQLGISDQMHKLRNQVSDKEYKKYQVRMELQADYYAGVWARYMEGQTFQGQPIMEAGDIEEALVAADGIGDDTLQRKHQGFVLPESFTHGTSKQRKNWFYRGYEYGDFQHGDTFNAKNLDLN